ncbi:MAG: hypothetical protein HYR76_00295 [Ignavibacteria bacterium]|nr:hypothetical protein [Ignavibacteria bacterium]
MAKELSAFEGRLEVTFDGFEKRLEARLDIQTESLKGYVDSRISQVNVKMESIQQNILHHVDARIDRLDKRIDNVDKKIDSLDKKIDNLDKKLDVRVDGLVDLIERRAGETVKIEKRLENHERRITALESPT